jgi:hypothetical protein
MTKEDYMKLSKERLAELLAERDSNIRIVPMPIESWHLSCYEGGSCTNPFHDCINCPRQFSGDETYTTTTISTSKD